MTSISVNHISLSYGMNKVLEDVTFQAETGDRIGFVGVNGSGKTTLFHILCGETTQDSGSVSFPKYSKIGILEQNVVSDSNECSKTITEDMFSAFEDLLSMENELRTIELKIQDTNTTISEKEKYTNKYTSVNEKFISLGGLEFKARCYSLLNKLGFQENRYSDPVSSLSGGERARLSIAKLLYREPDMLMLDEPTNHLDIETVSWLETQLSSYPKTLLIVSHDRYFLDKVTNKTVNIENHKAKLYNCPYTEFIARKKEDKKNLQKQYDLQQKEIARQKAFIKQQKQWNRERNIIAAESREKALERMVKIDKPESVIDAVSFKFSETEYEPGNDILMISGLEMSYDKLLFSNVSFTVKKGDRLFIYGSNGTGKSTLLKIITGSEFPKKGFVNFGTNVVAGYYDQENQQLCEEKTVIDELWDRYPDMTSGQIRGTLAAFHFFQDDINKKVSSLSGGERARLTLAKLVLFKTNLLILDEPTNHLDIDTAESLEDALMSYHGTIIAVSHDRYFVNKLATHILDIEHSPCVLVKGNFDTYITQKDHRNETDPTENKSCENIDDMTEQKSLFLKQKEDAARIRQNKALLDRTINEIEDLEKKLVEVIDELDSSGSDYVKAGELYDKKTVIEDRLMQLYEIEEKSEQDQS